MMKTILDDFSSKEVQSIKKINMSMVFIVIFCKSNKRFSDDKMYQMVSINRFNIANLI